MCKSPLCVVAAIALIALVPCAALAEEPVDLDAVNRIRDEGFHRSRVMETLEHLTDVIGPRLTGSPAMKQANEWTRDQLASWGLENAHLEPFDFGRGWTFSRTAVHLLEPREVPLIALPEAWSPGTRRALKGPAMHLKIESEKDLEEHKGKLAGKILLLDEAVEIEPDEAADFRRYAKEDLEELVPFEIRERRFFRRRAEFRKRWELRRKLRAFLKEEKVLATVHASSRGDGILRLGGTGAFRVGEDEGVPSVVLVAEQYNLLARLLDKDVPVELEIDVKARFLDDDHNAYDTVAEIPGSDLADQVVMLGAHLDSWHPGTGATDNGAGSAVTMEAVRILKALGIQPRRTVRIALWSGEEQGLLGSIAYVKAHFASRPEPDDPEEQKLPRFLQETRWPIEVKPEHATLSAYFNIDNGSGKIRGVYTQENAAVVPIFKAWLAPFADLGADTITLNNTGGTDHLSFDGVGLPGFQFIQDPLDYSALTHHTDLDTLDHVQQEDLMQASVILASFVYHAAMRDDMMPRKPMPQQDPREKEKQKEKEMEGDAGGTGR